MSARTCIHARIRLLCPIPVTVLASLCLQHLQLLPTLYIGQCGVLDSCASVLKHEMGQSAQEHHRRPKSLGNTPDDIEGFRGKNMCVTHVIR